MSGIVTKTERYGSWVTLDVLPSVPALLEFANYGPQEPTVGDRIRARIAHWLDHECRLTQISDS